MRDTKRDCIPYGVIPQSTPSRCTVSPLNQLSHEPLLLITPSSMTMTILSLGPGRDSWTGGR